jgi:hypothetical protein
MSTPTGEDTGLLQTIAELRSDVNRLIDEQLARVHALDTKRVAAPAPGPAPAAERRFSTPQPAHQPAARPSRNAAAARAPEPAATAPEPAPSSSDDPSQRLDALARHLDGRLRRSGGKAKSGTDTPGSTSEAKR